MNYRMLLVFGLVIAVSTSFGNERSGSVDGATAISSTVDQVTKSRILVDLDIPSLPQGASVEYAELTIPYSPEGDGVITFTIDGYKMTTEWQDETVTWSSPWTNAGGDFDTLSYCTYTYSSDLFDNIKLDITKIVSAWNDGAANYGLILSKPNYEGDAFGSEAQDLVTALGEAEVAIYYVQIPE